jgi:hypothetical protein
LRVSLARGESSPNCAPAREALLQFTEPAQPVGAGYAQAVLAECLRRNAAEPAEVLALLETAVATLREALGPQWPETAYAEDLLEQAR